ncbi:hypothetical protein GCM10010176_073080 [Nonomuraea spiralis]|uniref:serine/threonine-protein kinase n=1 Tax=Nonomuraea spiralis TaxID=46182 RepID=UPI0019C1DC9F|nr:serine/threonine-protein kinase [Nonomuraea spiralis]GGT17944.1 hypothetical protein GCM10010176_073080 [Nonomuraea spiralis]
MRAPSGYLLAARYRLMEPVGRGGMGTVWRAHDELLDRDVAVKEVRLPTVLDEELRAELCARTEREGRATAMVAHPSVITVFDVVTEDDRPWIVMELLRAKSLEQLIQEHGPLHPRRAAEIGRQILGALRAVHAKGILHRDVKPSNVLVTEDRAVLTDSDWPPSKATSPSHRRGSSWDRRVTSHPSGFSARRPAPRAICGRSARPSTPPSRAGVCTAAVRPPPPWPR